MGSHGGFASAHRCPLGNVQAKLLGVPLDRTEIITVDSLGNALPQGEVGELASKGSQIMSGYWNSEKATAEAFTREGYLLTGDIGYVSSDGVYLFGRSKDVINSGGYKVWPSEVENVLLENPHVAEAAVVGVKDEFYGEAVKAFLVLRSHTTEVDLRQFCKDRLSGFKVPRYFEFRKNLPKSSIGKVLHRMLREDNSD